jgi:hypothetical protein
VILQLLPRSVIVDWTHNRCGFFGRFRSIPQSQHTRKEESVSKPAEPPPYDVIEWLYRTSPVLNRQKHGRYTLYPSPPKSTFLNAGTMTEDHTEHLPSHETTSPLHPLLHAMSDLEKIPLPWCSGQYKAPPSLSSASEISSVPHLARASNQTSSSVVSRRCQILPSTRFFSFPPTRGTMARCLMSLCGILLAD